MQLRIEAGSGDDRLVGITASLVIVEIAPYEDLRIRIVPDNVRFQVLDGTFRHRGRIQHERISRQPIALFACELGEEVETPLVDIDHPVALLRCVQKREIFLAERAFEERIAQFVAA